MQQKESLNMTDPVTKALDAYKAMKLARKKERKDKQDKRIKFKPEEKSSNRDYQDAIIRTVESMFADPNKRRLTIQCPTGAGKTRIATQLVRRMGAHRVLYIVPSKEIFAQTSAKLEREGIAHAQLSAGKHPTLTSVRVLLAMSQTLARRKTSEMWEKWMPDVLVIDEIHKLIGQHRSVTKMFRCPVIGMTATPCRLDGQDLSDITPFLVQGPTVEHLQRQGYLVPDVVYTAPSPDLGAVKVIRGDYAQGELEQAYIAQGVFKIVPEYWRRYASGRRTITFASGVDISQKMVLAYQAAGIRAEHVDGTTKESVRQAALERLKNHEIDVLCNVGLFIEGLDLVEVDCITLCQPTRSVARYIQQVGRGLRLSPHTNKKNLVVIDHSGNTYMHGKASAVRDWQRGGFCEQKHRDVRSCRFCGVLTPNGHKQCIACGFEHDARNLISTTVRARLEREKSKDTPLRVCPPWARLVRSVWYRYERERAENGYRLPSSRATGYVESRCLKALKEVIK